MTKQEKMNIMIDDLIEYGIGEWDFSDHTEEQGENEVIELYGDYDSAVALANEIRMIVNNFFDRAQILLGG